jgi:hypothetical protein
MKGGKVKSKKGRWLMGVIVGAALIASLPAFGQEEGMAGAVSRFSLGAGLGIPFGVIGLSCEMNPILGAGPDVIAKYFSFNVGLGYAGAGPGYSLGFRFYPMGRDRVWAPKVSLMYGTVLVVNWEHTYRGFSVGAGVVRRLRKKTSLDADLIFIINRFGYSSTNWEGGRLKVSRGVRRSLD